MSTPRSGPRYKLSYFPFRARAEVIRLTFKAAGVPFVDEVVSMESWPKRKSETPTGSLPVLEIAGEQFAESGAILRWAARKFGLAGKTDSEQLRVEEAIAGADEVKGLFLTWQFIKDDGQKTEKEEQLKKQAQAFLSRWDKLAVETKGNKKTYTYLVGTALTVADLCLLDLVEKLSSVPDLDLSAFPKLQSNKMTVTSLSPIKHYLETRPDYPC